MTQPKAGGVAVGKDTKITVGATLTIIGVMVGAFGYLDGRIEGRFDQVSKKMESNDKELGSKVVQIQLSIKGIESREIGNWKLANSQIEELKDQRKEDAGLIRKLEDRLTKLERN